MTPLNRLPLASLRAGALARVAHLGGDRAFRRRLMELGLIPGTPLRVLRRVDVGGLVELEVRSCRLTLRRAEARELMVALDG
jgi:ferrous iron transport protein A